MFVVQLKMSVNRLRLMQQKQSALAKQARRELAQLLEQGKEESARIRVENIIREDLFVEMLEILELYCELLLARFGLLEQMYRYFWNSVCNRVGRNATQVSKKLLKRLYTLPPAQNQKNFKKYSQRPVTFSYALQVRSLLVMRFGHPFAQTAIDNSDNKVSL